MSVLGAFESTWSNARSTFGGGSPATGEPYDKSSNLRQMESDLSSAAPGSRWSGAASDAYDAANTEHRRVFGALAGLDQRLKTHIDESAAAVAAGRSNLDAVRQWVTAAAASIPPGQAGEQMKLAIAKKGIAGIIDVVTQSNGELNTIGERLRALGAEYEKLGEQRFGKGGIAMYAGGEGEGKGEGDEKGWKPDTPYEEALHEAGLLHEEPTGYYQEWLQNADKRDVPPETIVEIASQQDLSQEDFDVLNGMERWQDKQDKSFFLLPQDISEEDAKKAVLMTYILNCGTDYGKNPQTDFEETPYSAAEVQRIADRQDANSWSYTQDVAFIHEHGGRLVTTPNGIMMGLGGDWLTDRFSMSGGTAWGDIYMENIDNIDNPAAQLQQIVESGRTWGQGDDGVPYETVLDLDRLLHHEERHSQQWAQYGYLGFIDAYASGKIIDIFTDHPLEEDAGLSDGGY